MKRLVLAVLLAALTAGCASTAAIVPALDGAQRVPINREIPSSVPFLAPQNTTTTGDQR